MNPSAPSPRGLPLVVQVAFAGARQLLDTTAHPGMDAARFESALQDLLAERLRRLPAELGLNPDRHFICGLSSLAIGGDTLFARACATLGWPLRVFLPQYREDFLRATGSDGRPDFTDAERAAARALLDAPHVIQERVVGGSPDRHQRFQEVNLELVRVADVLVCLLRACQPDRPGGTAEPLADARSRSRPALELRVHVGPGGRPELRETWHHRDRFAPPALPPELADLRTELTGLPPAEKYCLALKGFGSSTSKARQRFFKLGALVVVAAHFFATLAAVVALKVHGAPAVPWILVGEILLLLAGFFTHRRLHRSAAVRVWAMARLVAETVRSTLALRQTPVPLDHLFSLPLPSGLRPLLRTLNVLHLGEARARPASDWTAARDGYLRERLTDPGRGQIPYYEGQLGRAKGHHRLAHGVFVAGSLGAVAATGLKLLLVCHCLPVPAVWHDGGAAGLGVLAVLLPVLAVAALSLAAAYDLEARVHTFNEMLAFLRAQAEHLRAAPTEAAFHALARETESRLLGETAAWHARRAFTGIA